MAAIAAPFQVLATWDAGAYQAAGAAIGAWITSFAVAYWLGSKFVAEHPFSFPSILWKRKSAPVSAAPAANAEQPEEQAPVITPSWMKENKPWWKR
jgi:hypothetical protein